MVYHATPWNRRKNRASGCQVAASLLRIYLFSLSCASVVSWEFHIPAIISNSGATRPASGATAKPRLRSGSENKVGHFHVEFLSQIWELKCHLVIGEVRWHISYRRVYSICQVVGNIREISLRVINHSLRTSESEGCVFTGEKVVGRCRDERREEE